MGIEPNIARYIEFIEVNSVNSFKVRFCATVFLDVSQAFDRVCPGGLFYILFFKLNLTYLTGRHIQINSLTSNSTIVIAGVPKEGSPILSPFL